jgi:hypothetical protein
LTGSHRGSRALEQLGRQPLIAATAGFVLYARHRDHDGDLRIRLRLHPTAIAFS